jgi:addiction module RelE/StbE family toxin
MSFVQFARSAQTDLLEAWLFIAEENPNAADHVLDAIEREANLLATQPLMGRARPELVDGVRSWPTSTPYILYYMVATDGIVVLRILHHARDVRQAAFKTQH